MWLRKNSMLLFFNSALTLRKHRRLAVCDILENSGHEQCCGMSSLAQTKLKAKQIGRCNQFAQSGDQGLWVQTTWYPLTLQDTVGSCHVSLLPLHHLLSVAQAYYSNWQISLLQDMFHQLSSGRYFMHIHPAYLVSSPTASVTEGLRSNAKPHKREVVVDTSVILWRARVLHSYSS